MRRNRLWAVMIVTVALFVGLSAVVLGSQFFTFSDLVPANGATIATPNLRISTYVEATAANIVKNSASITLNGQTSPAVFTQWYTPKDCQIYFNAKNLTDGVKQVEFSIKDANNNTGVVAWQFTVRVRPVITEMSPANNSTHTLVSVIRAKVTDANDILTAANMVMKLNGETVAHTYNASTYFVEYQIPTPLPSGTHNVWLQAIDAAGNERTAIWSFNVNNDPPSFTNLSPAQGATVGTPSPEISVKVSDTNSNLVQSSVEMYVNNSPVTPTFTYELNELYQTDYKKATIRYTPTVLPDGITNVMVRVANQAGVTGEATWSFTVAVPPTFSNLVPANNSVHHEVTEVTATAMDSNGSINPSSIRMKINNIDVVQEKLSFNEQSGKITAAFSEGLANGTQTIWLEVADMAGNKRNATWSFTVNRTPPEFHSATPADGSTVTTGKPVIRVEIDDSDGIKNGTAKMYLDDENVNATFTYHTYLNHIYQWVTDYTKGTLTYSPSALSNGVHTVRAEAADEPGNFGSYTWSFTVAAPPQILEITPATNTTIVLQRPVVNVDFYSNEAIQAEDIQFTVNGTQVATQLMVMEPFYYRISYQPPVNWPDEEYVALALRITGDSGLETNRSWTYYVNVKGDMPGSGKDISTCSMCHDGMQIKQQLCLDCHAQYDAEKWQGECFRCHLDYYDAAIHTHHGTSNYPHNTINDHELNVEEIGGCGICHSKVLTREHNRNALTCGSCHQSQDSFVITAIQFNNKTCNACHAFEGTGSAHSDFHDVRYSATCASCHGDNMMMELIYHQNGCDTCHSSTDPVVQDAIKYQKSSCFDCHSEPHGVQMVVVADDIPKYDGVLWGTPQIGRASCRETV